jgi:hypothetical protein
MCVLPESFVRLHNASANALPETTAGIDGAAAGVALSDAERTIADNYKTYHLVSDQLTELQKLFELMQKYIDMKDIYQQLDKFGDPIFKRLITDKTDSIIREYDVTHTSINYDLENTEQWIIIVNYFYIFLLGLFAVGILYFAISNLI